MSTVCDHTSVGVLVWKGEKLLLIERAKFPFGFAVPAGHLDHDTDFEQAAVRELKEETGLDAEKLTLLLEGRKENSCSRKDGAWHYWKLYEVNATGRLRRSGSESKQAGWYSKTEIRKFAQRTTAYKNGTIMEDEWEQDPGMEPVMQEWFVTLMII